MPSIPLPRPFAAFRSIRSAEGPFEHLRRFLEGQARRPLSFSDFALSPGDWQDFRFQTWRWLYMRGDTERLEALLRPGKTAPLLSNTCKPFSAELRAVCLPVAH